MAKTKAIHANKRYILQPNTLGAAPTADSQLGYTMVLSIASTTNTPATTAEANPFGSTFTLPVGVYQLNYQYRFRSTSSAVITALIINNPLSTPQSGPKNYGLYINNSMNVTVTGSGTGGSFSITGSSIIVNATPSNVLTPSFIVYYTPPGSLQFTGAHDTYVAVTRIG